MVFKTMPVIKIFFIEGYHPNLKDTETVPGGERYLNQLSVYPTDNGSEGL
jgi:hypothetical protein